MRLFFLASAPDLWGSDSVGSFSRCRGTVAAEVGELDLKNGKRSRRRVRDLVTQLAFEAELRAISSVSRTLTGVSSTPRDCSTDRGREITPRGFGDACEVGGGENRPGSCKIVKWRAMADEDGQYSFAVAL